MVFSLSQFRFCFLNSLQPFTVYQQLHAVFSREPAALGGAAAAERPAAERPAAGVGDQRADVDQEDDDPDDLPQPAGNQRR